MVRIMTMGSSILLMIFIIAAFGAPVEKYTYTMRTGNKSVLNRWTREIKSGTIVLGSANMMTGESDRMICDGGYETIEWFYTNGNKDVRLSGTRKNNLVEISGFANGKPVRTSITLKAGAWYQFPEFALSHMLASGRDSAVYYIFWPDKFIFYTMKAKRIGNGPVSYNGKTINAVKVKVTLAGFKSIFWSSYYWFRNPDYLFLRYEGVHGLPGTGATVIELVGW
jgi:hypothetical protein